MTFWKKNEKDEMIAKKKAEKEALEKAKAEEEAREAKRQSRKLNFLLTQTELYSHFIGKKIKTKEAEGEDAEDGTEANEDLGLDASGEPLPDLDYDDGQLTGISRVYQLTIRRRGEPSATCGQRSSGGHQSCQGQGAGFRPSWTRGRFG